jgi:hypothetical protein
MRITSFRVPVLLLFGLFAPLGGDPEAYLAPQADVEHHSAPGHADQSSHSRDQASTGLDHACGGHLCLHELFRVKEPAFETADRLGQQAPPSDLALHDDPFPTGPEHPPQPSS